MLVGNDIVDLHDPWSQPGRIHRRFDSRTFTPTERAHILASRSAHHVRWSLWAAKESAFKVARKLDARVRFLPRNFAVRMLDDARAEVSHRLGCFRVWFERADEWVHAVAVFGVGSRMGLAQDQVVVAPAGGDGPSVRVREVARAAAGSFMNVSPTEIRVVTGQGIPVLYRGDERLPLDLSLSHDGRFVACAWAVDGSLSG